MSEDKKSIKQCWSLRRKLLVFIPLALVVVGLALGLGLGLTIGRDSGDDNDDDDTPPATVTSPPLPSPTGSTLWTPRVNDTWQIILSNPLALSPNATSLTPNVSIYDIDLFTNNITTIETLHQLGKKVICYFSGGSYEPGRPDSGDFNEVDMGKELDGWPGERWLLLNSSNVRNIMKKRVQLAKDKGCDGVDPDNVDGYQNTNGLGLTAQDSIDFMAYLSNLTTPLNLAMGLKNAGDIIDQVLPVVHFSVNEQCVDETECDMFHSFISAGKPVFHIEYPKGAGEKLKFETVQNYCDANGNARGSTGFSTVLKKMELDGWVEYCDQSVEVTALNTTGSSK